MIFTTPLLLLTLLALPALWWLLRLMPPRPKKEIFPPLILMRDIVEEKQTPHATPWWLLLLRVALVAFLVLGLAQPLLRPAATPSNAPLVLIVDDGFGAAKNFKTLQKKGEEILLEAERASRLVALVSTTRPPKSLLFLNPQEAKNQLKALEPTSYAPQFDEVNALYSPSHETVFLSDGLEYGTTLKASKTYAQALAAQTFITKVEAQATGLSVTLANTSPQEATHKLVAFDAKGREVLTQLVQFQGLKHEFLLELPRDVRNNIVKLTLQGEGHIGATHHLDQRKTRKLIALVTGVNDVTQPLLSSSFYLEKALAGLGDVSTYKEATNEAIKAAIESNASVLFLSEVGTLAPQTLSLIEAYTQKGGVLVRFASVRLQNDTTLPVALLNQARQLGGVMSWATPKKIAPFKSSSLFYGLDVPLDVTISRQVLAEPDGELADKTLASLEDGTPLLTLARKERGLSLLFHVSATPNWSNLPLSGLFTGMLERIVSLGGRTEAITLSEDTPLTPLKIFNGYGELTALEAKPLPPNFQGAASKIHPSGLYGLAESPASVNSIYTMKLAQEGLFYGNEEARNLTPYFLSLAFALFLLDCGVMLRLTRVFILLFLFLPLPLEAQEKGEMRLAFVQNGSSDDAVTLAALKGLTRYISNRTTLEPEEPLGLTFEKDELSLYPVLFWAIQPNTPKPSPKALIKLEAYLKNGGLLVIDTADANQSGVTPAVRTMRSILGLLDIPALSPVPENHVLGRTYYLLETFPGRFSQGTVWIETLPTLREEDDRPARASDSVSPIIITNQDWLGAWAIDASGRSLLPLEGAPRQRDMAFRVGVNLVLYALTGNYKADQVHVPELLNRLRGGQRP